MFLYIKTNILRGYGIFKNDFAHPREPANITPPTHRRCAPFPKGLAVLHISIAPVRFETISDLKDDLK